MPRVSLKGVFDETSDSLATQAHQAEESPRYWGAIGDEREVDDDSSAARFLECVPDFSGDGWPITLAALEAAVAATTGTSAGPDSLPYALYRGVDWTALYLWVVLRGIVDDDTNTGAQEFCF